MVGEIRRTVQRCRNCRRKRLGASSGSGTPGVCVQRDRGVPRSLLVSSTDVVLLSEFRPVFSKAPVHTAVNENGQNFRDSAILADTGREFR